MGDFMRYYITIMTWLVVGLMLAACGQVDDPLTAETPTMEVIEKETAVPEPPPATRAPLILDAVDEELAEQHSETIRFGRALVAEDLRMEAAQLTVTAVEAVEWPDGCLGLGQPGEACTEALVPGLRIQVTLDDQIYEIRTDLDGRQYRWIALQ
jgi:hypothetical protein